MANAEEIRRAREETSFFAPLFEYARSNRSQLASEGRRPVLGGLLSKEPVMGTDTLRYEGVGSLLANLLDPIARGVDAPRAAAQGLIPQEDMVGEAFGTAGTAMLGGGAVAKPAGSLGANTLRVYHGGPQKLSASDVEMRPDPEGTPIGFSVTDNPDIAEYYRNMRGGGSISEFDIDLDKANIISESELYEFIDDLENRLDADPSYKQIQRGLLDAGVDAIEYPDPEFGIRVVNPNILGANASKSAGLLGQTMFTDDVYHYMKSPAMEGDVLDTSRSSGRLNRLGPHVGTARAAEERFEGLFGIRPDQTALLEMAGYNTPTEKLMAYLSETGETTGATLPLRARLDQPFLNQAGKPFSETELLEALNRYADQNNIEDLDAATDMFRKDLTDSGFTNIPYINDYEDAGSVSHIMLTGRTAGDPEVLRSRFAAFEDAYDPNIMAANASPMSGLLAQSGVSSEQAQEIEDYLLKTGLLQ